MDEKIEFVADKISIRGPRVDGSWIISLETGEYEKEKVARLIKIEGNVKVIIEPESRGIIP